jgi:hypothetical protein
MGIMEKLSDMRRKKLDESCHVKSKAEVKKPKEEKPDKKFEEAVELLNSCGMIVEAKS